MNLIMPEKRKIFDELTKGVELRNFIEYQEGSIVSKTLIDKNTGTITLFAFDRGQSLSEHTAPFDALVYVFDGEAEIIISKISHRLHSGQMILMPVNAPHALKAIARFKMMLIMIKSQ